MEQAWCIGLHTATKPLASGRRHQPGGFSTTVRGTRFRESSGSRNRAEAEKLLQRRLEAAAQGKPIGPKAGKAMFEDLARILLDDYRANVRRSLERVEGALGHLRGFFGGVRQRSRSPAIVSRAT